MIKGILIGLIALVMSTTVQASSQQFMYEKNLTDIAQNAMDAMYGKGNFVVRVKVDMAQPRYNVKYTQQSNPSLRKEKKTKKEVYILPGVPAIKNIAPDAFNQLPFDSVTTLSNTSVKRMSVYVLANRSFPKSKARKSEPVLRQLLGLKDGRDKIKYDYRPFYYNPSSTTQNITIVPGKEKVFSIQNLFYLVFAGLLLALIILYVKYASRITPQAEGGSGGTSVSVNPNLELPRGAGGSGGGSSKLKMSKGEGIKEYFDFVSEENIQNFIYLVQKDGLKPEYIATISAFLSSDLASKIISVQSIENQAIIAANLIDQKLASRDMLEKMESKYRTALECFTGGVDNFQIVFSDISEQNKKEILNILEQRQPEVYQKVRQQLILFEDIKLLSDDELKKILSEAQLELLATALVSVEQDLYQRIDENLTTEARAMIAQYLELKSNNTSRKDIEAAQDYILKVLKRLEDAGKIDLASKIT